MCHASDFQENQLRFLVSCPQVGEIQGRIPHDLPQQAATDRPLAVDWNCRPPPVSMMENSMTSALSHQNEFMVFQYLDDFPRRERRKSFAHTAILTVEIPTSSWIGSPRSSRSFTCRRIASSISSFASFSISPSV
jgi:hypothetical protein